MKQQQLQASLCACMQTRALQTYVKRVYYPFLLRDPEIHALDGVLCVLWVHTHPTMSGSPHAHSSLSVAVVVPALSALPAALATIEDLIAGSGLGTHWNLNLCRVTRPATLDGALLCVQGQAEDTHV